MVKYLKKMLIMLLCLSLVACSGTTDKKENPVINEKFANLAENIVYIVNFSINPLFELHLDDAGYIIDFHCLNDDANKIFENTDILEKYCDVGINELLDVASNKGYLTANSKIEVISYVSRKCTISDVIKNNIEDTLKNYQSKINFTYSHKVIDGNEHSSSIEDNITNNNENNSINNEFDENRYIEVERDENGNVIRTVELDNQNRTLSRYYNSQGMMICEKMEDKDSTLTRTFDDSVLIKEEYHENNGNYTITEYDDKGDIEKETEVLNNGLTITRYYVSGVIEKMEQISQEGKEVAYYDTNGVVKKAITTSNDGTIHTMQYENGVISTDEWSDPNTGINAVATYKNGVIVSHIKNGNNGFYEYTYYDANGNITEILDLDNQGRDRKKVYNPDGSCSVYISAGGKWVEVNN